MILHNIREADYVAPLNAQLCLSLSEDPEAGEYMWQFNAYRRDEQGHLHSMRTTTGRLTKSKTRAVAEANRAYDDFVAEYKLQK